MRAHCKCEATVSAARRTRKGGRNGCSHRCAHPTWVAGWHQRQNYHNKKVTGSGKLLIRRGPAWATTHLAGSKREKKKFHGGRAGWSPGGGRFSFNSPSLRKAQSFQRSRATSFTGKSLPACVRVAPFAVLNSVRDSFPFKPPHTACLALQSAVVTSEEPRHVVRTLANGKRRVSWQQEAPPPPPPSSARSFARLTEGN